MTSDFAIDSNDKHVRFHPEPSSAYHDIDTLDDFDEIEDLFCLKMGINRDGDPVDLEEFAYPD